MATNKTEQTTWTLTLNKYQRDNLLWLINACGWPWGIHTVAPFGCANTGDWIGEIGWMLAKEGQEPLLDENDRPNTSFEQLARNVANRRWGSDER